ncbi:MAG TPA: hypothetical protein VHM67_01285 [Gemmatimonadaceae bacterium]|nr:hypothetical protein [Gemmatimonadaceae bacterium]
MDPLELLARDDKWFLGGGDGAIYAPTAPLWLDHPGFWDGATIYQADVTPLFTVAVLDEEGRELELRVVSRRWTPAELTVEYRVSNGVTATEVRTVHPGGVFVSEWRLRALSTTRIQLVAWTAQPDTVANALSAKWNGAIGMRRTVRTSDRAPLEVTLELSAPGTPRSWGAYVGNGGPPQPRWSWTQFPERWRGDGIPRELRVARDASGGTLFAAVHRGATIGGRGASATFAMRVVPAAPTLAPRQPAPSRSDRHGTLGGVSRRRWHGFFDRVPHFRCSDPYLETCYWYRWYGVWLNAVAGGAGAYAEPALCEGVGERHAPRAAAIASHVRELRWMHDPAHARGVMRAFLARQAEDGALPSRVPLQPSAASGAEPAPWGDALLALDAASPDDGFVREAFAALAKYAEWLARERDRERSGLYDGILDPGTPEPSPRFAGRAMSRPLKAIEPTVWAYTLLRALERLAPRAGAQAARWRELADRTMRAVRERMWDPGEGLFRDVDADGWRRSTVRAAAGFYVYGSDLANADHLQGLERNLLDPDRFWTAFPVPSVSLDDLAFTPYPERGGEGDTAPRGGRAVPFVIAQTIDGAARAALAYAPHLRTTVARLLQRFVRLLFREGDLGRPNCFPDYNPFTGHPGAARGLDDHLLAPVNDLIIQYVAGVRPHGDGITVDPFPFGLDRVELREVHVRGRTLDITIDGDRVSVAVDGTRRESRLGTRMEI